jgi:hypothetical protein
VDDSLFRKKRLALEKQCCQNCLCNKGERKCTRHGYVLVAWCLDWR